MFGEIMEWVVEKACDVFDGCRTGWDDLNLRCGNHVLLDSRFVGPLLRHFGDERVLLAVSRRLSEPGMLLLRNRNLGFWETLQPSQAPVGLVLLEPGAEEFRGLFQLLRELPGPTLGLSLLQQDPEFSSFKNYTDSRATCVDYINTPRLTLRGTFEDYWKTQSKAIDSMHNLSRRQRRLARLNMHLNLRIDRHPDRVLECVAQHGRLEASGWKGRSGTAVTAENKQGAFYTEMLTEFSRRNEAVIYGLYFNDRLAASQLALERNGMLIFLKTAYDEELKEFSPGFLMQLEILKTLYAEGRVKVIEFYGRARDWHEKWRAETRIMYHVNLYRCSWVPRLRRFVKILPRF